MSDAHDKSDGGEMFVLPSPPMICAECVRKKPVLHNPTMTAYLHCPHTKSVACYSIPQQRWELWSPIADEAFIEGVLEASRMWQEALQRRMH